MTLEDKQKQLKELHMQVPKDSAKVVFKIIELEKELYRAQMLYEGKKPFRYNALAD